MPRYTEFKKKRYEYDYMNDSMNVVLTLAAILYFGITVGLILFLNSKNSLKNKETSYRSLITLNKYVKAIT